jgi:hypothetical protein
LSLAEAHGKEVKEVKKMSYGKNGEKGKQYTNFFVFKKNKRGKLFCFSISQTTSYFPQIIRLGEFQRRMFQIDVGNKWIRNVKNFREVCLKS